jgi:energy-coupling factor transporter ATP-binding protein EcfA2
MTNIDFLRNRVINLNVPLELQNIFSNKQKSYKMVLIIAILTEIQAISQRVVPILSLKQRFLSLLQERESKGLIVDHPPEKSGTTWNSMTVNNLNSVISTPISALSSILEQNNDSIGFKKELYESWSDDVLNELFNYAQTELEKYYNQQTQDYFSLKEALSDILSAYLTAKKDTFAGHRLGNIVRQQIPGELRKLPFIHSELKITGSVGQGNWATIPWIAIMDKRITETTRQGEYLVYLFAEDMKSVYLTFNQGVTIPNETKGRAAAYQYFKQKVQEIRELLPLDGMTKDDAIYLTSGGIGQDYQVSTVAYYRYDLEQLPEDGQLVADLNNAVTNYNQYVNKVVSPSDGPEYTEWEEIPLVDELTVIERVATIKKFIASKGFMYPDHWIENFFLSLKAKPFVILAGVSGTGKTKLVKLFAEAVGATASNGQFSLIPVRPDWSDPSDLLGYKDLSGAFRPGKLTEVLVEASKPSNQHKPYFICLDEMNLARVEHYFSDLLSVLETQEWDNHRIVTTPLIHRDSLQNESDKHVYGNLHLPDNVYIVGTVNMDETTHPFSKKVLDRANTIEFNYIDLGQYPTGEGMPASEGAAVPPNSLLRSEYLQLVDVYRDYKQLTEETTELLVKINGILEQIHSHVGFRIRDAVCFYMIYNDRFALLSKEAAFDMQLLQKILPRIQGSNLSVKTALLQLMQVALDRSLPISDYKEDASKLYLSPETLAASKYPQSARKIAFMLRRLEEDGFTSYWLS